MTVPSENNRSNQAPMTPERWRLVDTILQAALACEPAQRDAFLADACGADEALRREVVSLLAAHDRMDQEFLEQPAIAAVGGASPPVDRTEQFVAALTDALAGRYAIEREIARGGMATVYLARDLRHDRQVAVKVMRDEVAAVVGADRFLEEIRVTALLQHPHILPLFDSGSKGALLWYVMPFVDGETLRARLDRDGRLSIEESVRLACEVAEALGHAHARGIVHRDIKPENVLLEGGHAVVADFGIALALENAGGERLTRTGLTLGTPHYMSPEQAAGERALDARVDVYALGAVLHEMLVGEAPFASPSRQIVLQRLLLEPPPALGELRADVPPAIATAVQRALAKKPNERFASAAQFAAALVAPEPLPRGDLSLASRAASEPVHVLGGARMATARVALYAALGGIGAGLVGGWGLAHVPMVNRWAGVPGWRPSAQRAAMTADAAPIIETSSTDGLSLVVVDRTGKVQRTIPANRPWTPRFSPNGQRIAYGAYGPGRNTSDVWITDLGAGKTERLTDDDADSNDPQWSPDGSSLAYSISAPGGKDIAWKSLEGGVARVLATRPGAQFPNDWLRDGSALLVTEESGEGHDILVQPANGAGGKQYTTSAADETSARISPDEHWVAYTSNESGKSEVYLDSYPRRGQRMLVSKGGGFDPVWRGDGRELYYWQDNALVALPLGSSNGKTPPSIGVATVLFHAAYHRAINTMYDAAPDGSRFVIIQDE